MRDRSDQDRPSYAQLLELVHGQQEQIERLEAQLTLALAEIERLGAENESLRRSQHRQAAPFSRNQPSQQRKPSGRKPGQGRFLYRGAPPFDAVDIEEVEAPVTERLCPRCGANLAAEGLQEATLLDLPEQLRLTLRRFRVHICRCPCCGKRVRGTHAHLQKDQQGATAHRIGPRLRALGHFLHYGLGLPQRKVPRLLKELFGLCLTQSALCQDALKHNRRQVGAYYQHLREQLPHSPVCYNDDTGWRIGGKPAWLMVCDTQEATVYQIRSRHRNQEVRELIPSDYRGVLTSDRARSYDAREFAGVRKQKCLSHLIRSCSGVLEHKHGRARWFAQRLKSLFQQALWLWQARTQLCAREYAHRRDALLQALTHHLRDRTLSDRDNQRLLDEMGWQQDRGNLLRFLLDPTHLEPTNNRAERAIRPAVIGRKVSHCSKNLAGAQAYSAFLSVIQTLSKQGADGLLDALCLLIAAPARAPTLAGSAALSLSSANQRG